MNTGPVYITVYIMICKNLLDTGPKAWRSSPTEGWNDLPSVGEGKVREMSLVGSQRILSADESMTGH